MNSYVKIIALFTATALCRFSITGAGELNVPLCPQEKSQWCWAASSQGMLKYYGFDVKQTECVAVKLPNLDNNPAPMTWIRDILNNWKCTNVYNGSHTFTEAEMKTEIDNLHPFCVFWHWNSGGGHFADISGYNNDIFTIMNPWPPNVGEWNKGNYNYVLNAQNSGNWNGTVWTTMDTKPTIRVTAPNGGEELEFNSTCTISWTDNIDGTVNIDLLKGGSVVKTIASSTASDGSHDWPVSTDLLAGSNYTIKIVSVDSAALFDASDNNFTIADEFIITQFPYIERFDTLDSGTAILPKRYEQLANDDLNWTVWKGKTPSKQPDQGASTGPDGDHTSGSGMYIYVESSGSNYPAKKADATTPKFCFKALSNPQLSFWYHMFSNNSGQDQMGDLYLDVCKDGTWQNGVAHLSKNNGDKWIVQTVDLNPYKGDRVIFKFRAVTGTGWASDICVDDFCIENSNGIGNYTAKHASSLNLKYSGSQVSFFVPEKNTSDLVRIALYNAQGKIVKTLLKHAVGAGYHTIALENPDNSQPFARGLYLCRIEVKNITETITIIISK